MKQTTQNLLERLKPEHRIKLNELEKSYPSTIGIINRTLESKIDPEISFFKFTLDYSDC